MKQKYQNSENTYNTLYAFEPLIFEFRNTMGSLANENALHNAFAC